MSYTETTIGFKPQKTADGNAQPAVVQKITVMPYNRRSVDLDDWRNASKAAESLIPRRVLLYNLYHDISTTDGQVMAVWQKRLDAVTSAEWQFTDKDGNPVEEINQLIDCIGFDDLLTEIMNSKAWGYSMVEPTFFKNDNEQNEFAVYSIPKKHMRPERGVIAFEQHGDDGINIREGIYAKTIMEFGKPDDLGLFLSASMYAILKRGNISDWAEFIEIFGRGIIDAEWDGFDEGQRQKLSKAILEMGGGGVIIRPAGTKVDIKNNTGNANGDLQAKFADKMDAYISKVLLGSTETTDSSKSSGYAQAEIHQEQDEKKNETDLTFVRRYLNSRFIKVLKAHGFDTKGGTFVLKAKRDLNKKQAFEIHKSMAKDLNIPFEDDFFYEEYGMPRPENYEKLKKEALERRNAVLEQKEAEENAPTPPASKQKDAKKPGNDKEELSTKPSVWRRLLRLFLSAPVLEKQPIAGAAKCCGEALTIKLASFTAEKVFDGIADGLIKRAWDAQGNFEFDEELFNYTATTLTAGFIEGWRSQPVKLTNIGFDYGADDPAALTAYEMNLFRFAGVKTLYEAQQLNELFRKSSSFAEFRQAAKKMVKIHNRDWLETEYNTAMAAGESAATYARLMKQVDIFPYWEYKTAGDDRVRHSHRLLDGVILPWNSPLWKYIFPPNDWNCRCYIVPRMASEVTKEKLAESEARVREYIASPAWKKAAKGGWGINRADKALVFTENQHYTSDYLDVLNKMDKISFEQYKLSQLKKYATPQDEKEIVIDENKADKIKSFIDSLEPAGNGRYALEDYKNRKLVITQKAINKHTADTQSYFDRHLYLEFISEALTKPDEVWLNNHGNRKFSNYIYIKHYKDYSLAVVCELHNNLELQINTWYDLQDDTLRRGLLIKK